MLSLSEVKLLCRRSGNESFFQPLFRCMVPYYGVVMEIGPEIWPIKNIFLLYECGVNNGWQHVNSWFNRISGYCEYSSTHC